MYFFKQKVLEPNAQKVCGNMNLHQQYRACLLHSLYISSIFRHVNSKYIKLQQSQNRLKHLNKLKIDIVIPKSLRF